MNHPSPNPLPAGGEGATCIVVLDDDPLGGQCVRDVPVLTSWSVEDLTAELKRSPAFLLLTNTRALTRQEAIERARQVGAALREAKGAANVAITPVWRSDSTLRGHFCHETHALDSAFRGEDAGRPVCVFLPYFGEAGRVTRDDTHYAVNDGALVPVHETEFARDPAYAFEHSHLPSWLEAHSGGEHRAQEVVSVSLEDLRSDNRTVVARKLAGVPPGGAVAVNAIEDDDLERFVTALHEVESTGQRFLCTGAAPFIRARLGQEKAPLLTAADLRLEGAAGGLTIVGSYVDRTTAQLERALADGAVRAIELNVEDGDPARVANTISKHLAAGEDVILHTSRTHTPGAAPAIADALGALVGRLNVRPRYLLVKGGSTASHLATEAFGVRRAVVIGQLLAGVPVWRLGDESRWPGLPFVIFAGNVGTEDSLKEALHRLREERSDLGTNL